MDSSHIPDPSSNAERFINKLSDYVKEGSPIHINTETGIISQVILRKDQQKEIDPLTNSKILSRTAKILKGDKKVSIPKGASKNYRHETKKVDKAAKKIAKHYEQMFNIKEKSHEKEVLAKGFEDLAESIRKDAMKKTAASIVQNPDKITRTPTRPVHELKIDSQLKNNPTLSAIKDSINLQTRIKKFGEYLKLEGDDERFREIGEDINRHFNIDDFTSSITLSDSKTKDVFRTNEDVQNASQGSEVTIQKFRAAMQYLMGHLDLVNGPSDGKTKAERIMEQFDQRTVEEKGESSEKIRRFIIDLKNEKVGGQDGPKIAKFFALFSQSFLQSAGGIETAPKLCNLPPLKHNQQSLKWDINIDADKQMTAKIAIDFVDPPKDDSGNPISRIDDEQPRDHKPQHKLTYTAIFKADINQVDSGELEVNIEQKALDNEGIEAESIRYLLNELGFEIGDIVEMNEEDKKIKFS
jgi:hypothetical protein